MSNCQYWPECKVAGHCECEAAAESADRPWLLRSRYRFIAVSASLLVLIYVVGMVAFAVAAMAHEAASGMFEYPPLCCNSARTSPTGDRDTISSAAVIARADGYHVNLGVGAHPKLLTKGYACVIPYNLAKPSPDGQFHICLSTDGEHRYCFFAPPPGV
jgi:hypothetical protein